jgi:hypothetical protein
VSIEHIMDGEIPRKTGRRWKSAQAERILKMFEHTYNLPMWTVALYVRCKQPILDKMALYLTLEAYHKQNITPTILHKLWLDIEEIPSEN